MTLPDCIGLTDEYAILTEGSVFFTSAGSYSDYCVEAGYTVLKPFNIKEICLELMNEEGFPKTVPTYEGSGFTQLADYPLASLMGNLVAKGYIKEIEIREFHEEATYLWRRQNDPASPR